MTDAEFLYVLQNEASIFNIFTALLCQPTDDLSKDDRLFQQLTASMQIRCSQCTNTSIQLGDSLHTYTVTELLVEYTRLFIGPFHLLVPPYSGLYFGATELMNDQTLWVINFYKNMGLAYDVSIKDSPDHIAVETEFLYFLLFHIDQEYRKDNQEESFRLWHGYKVFLSMHYKKWVPLFCDKIKQHTTNHFYRLLAVCLESFINDSTHFELPCK